MAQLAREKDSDAALHVFVSDALRWSAADGNRRWKRKADLSHSRSCSHQIRHGRSKSSCSSRRKKEELGMGTSLVQT